MKLSLTIGICLLFLISGPVNQANGITNPKIKWKFKTQGPIRAAGSVSGSAIYFGGTDGFLYAVDKENGSLLWKFESKGSITDTPLLTGDLVIFSSRDNNVYALNSKSGDLVWTFQMQPTLSGYTEWEYFMAAPVASGTQVFVGSGDGNLYALNQADGKLIWKYKTDGRIRSTPLVVDKTVYQASNDGIVYAIHADSGKLLWGFKTKGASLDKSQGFDRTNIFSRPCLKDNLLIFGSRDGNVYAVDINTGEVKWNFTYGSTWAMSTVIDETTVYVGWSTNKLFCAIDIKTGAEKWKYECKSLVYTTAALQGDQVVFGSADGNLYCFDKNTGKKSWEYAIGKAIHSSPLYDANTIYVGSDDGFFYALEEEKQIYTAVYNPMAKGGSTSYPLIEEKITPYLKDRHFKQLDSAKLYHFMEDRIKDKAPSVIVFAYDAIPYNIMGANPEKGMVRQYLDGGGKIIWFGWIPNLFYYDTKGKFVGPRDISIATRLLETEFSTPEESGSYYSRSTQEGMNWGLPTWFTSTHSISPTKVTALSYDENNKVGAWMKKFNNRPGSGFVSFRTWSWEAPIQTDDLELIYEVAMYGLK